MTILSDMESRSRNTFGTTAGNVPKGILQNWAAHTADSVLINEANFAVQCALARHIDDFLRDIRDEQLEQAGSDHLQDAHMMRVATKRTNTRKQIL